MIRQSLAILSTGVLLLAVPGAGLAGNKYLPPTKRFRAADAPLLLAVPLAVVPQGTARMRETAWVAYHERFLYAVPPVSGAGRTLGAAPSTPRRAIQYPTATQSELEQRLDRLEQRLLASPTPRN